MVMLGDEAIGLMLQVQLEKAHKRIRKLKRRNRKLKRRIRQWKPKQSSGRSSSS